MTGCKSNHKNLATALEMYASDNQGRYPVGFSSLTAGGYLKTIPTCPTAKADTYSPSYQARSNPDAFSFCCTGNNHAPAYTAFTGNSSGFPQYNSIDGLIDHP